MKIHVSNVLKSTLALTLIAGAVSANAAPLGKLVHLHPEASDGRIGFSLVNDSLMTRQVVVAGNAYAIEAHRSLRIEAPVGTMVYAGPNLPNHKKGTVLIEVKPEMKNKVIGISETI